MDSRTWVLGGVLLAGLAAASLWMFLPETEVAVAARRPAPAASAGSQVEAATSSVPDMPATPTPVARTEAPLIAAADTHATLRGRCVDANGTPLAGCKVRLSGSRANDERMEAWLRDHPAPEWKDPEAQATGTDGAFAFAFSPPPPFTFSLHIAADQHTTMSGRWLKIEERAAIDVGDVVLSRGSMLTGRVVDEAGVAVEKVHVSFAQRTGTRQERQEWGVLRPGDYSSAMTDADGRFTTRAFLLPASYGLQVLNREIVTPGKIEIVAGRAIEDVTIVVQTETVDPTQSISGSVVDETDKPVRGARVEANDNRERSSGSSDRDGRFTVKRGEGSTSDAAVLTPTMDGFEKTPTDKAIPWGSKDVVLRMQRGPVLTIRVTDEAATPVPDYTVRLHQTDARGWSSRDNRVRARGPFADGTATVPGITTGKWVAILEFSTASSFVTCCEPFEVARPGPIRLDVRALPAATRSLRVVTTSGKPIIGTHVQLADPMGRAFDERTAVLTLARFWSMMGPPKAMAIFEGTTGAEGTVALRGRSDRAFMLMLLGPGHIPVRIPDVRLDVAEELVVTVQEGARLTGRIVPPEAFAELRRTGRLGSGGPFAEDKKGQWPTLQLQQGSGVGQTIVPKSRDPALSIGTSGEFNLSGLPPGSWTLFVNYFEMSESGGGNGVHQAGPMVTLTEGQVTQVDIDLQTILPGTLQAEVTLNGAPLSNTMVSLLGGDRWVNLDTDDQGRFTYQGRPGTFALKVQRPRNRQAMPMLHALAQATVVRGETTRHTFTVASGHLQLKVLDQAGQPVSDLQVQMRPDAEWLQPTGPDGSTDAELTAQNITLHVLPKRLQSQEAQQKLWREAQAAGQTDALAPHWLVIGTTSIEQGQTHTLELRLPPEWEK